MTDVPIDLGRWRTTFGLLQRTLDAVERRSTPELRDTLHGLNIHYAAALATYSMMTAEQQDTVKESLEAVRIRLEGLAHDGNSPRHSSVS